LIRDGKLERGALGLAPISLEPYKAKEMGIDGGARVVNVPNGTPADIAGIKIDDIVVRVGNIQIHNETDVRDAMLNYAPGEKVEVEVIRDKSHKTFTVTLTTLSKLPGQNRQLPSQSSDDGSVDPDIQKMFPGITIPPFGKDGDKGSPWNQDVPRTGAAKLGITVQDVTSENSKTYSIPGSTKGAVVTSVSPGYPADKIGLEVGDVIQDLGGKAVDSAQALTDAMKGRKWGEACTIKFSRYSSSMTASQEKSFKF
jgi:S1-C subfamily serine protease